MPTLDIHIAAGADDGESRASGSFNATAGATALGLSLNIAIDGFYRFANVTVPAGATINVAYLTYVEVGSQNPGSILSNIYMNDEDDAAAPTTRATHDAKVRTTAFTAFDDLTGIATAGVSYDTPSFAAAVQEVVDRAGWVSGNDMMVLWDDDGSTHASQEAYVQPAAIEHATYTEPILHIEYTYDETGRFVSIVSTVTATSILLGEETLAFTITSTVTGTDTYFPVGGTNYDETGRLVTVTSTVTVTDTLNLSEALTVTITSTVSESDSHNIAGGNNYDETLEITIVVTATTTDDFSPTEDVGEGLPVGSSTASAAEIRIEVWSLPDDPDGFRLLCEPPYVNGTSFQDRADVYGGGQLIVPADYEHLDLIVEVDPTVIQNSHSSLIRGLQFHPTDESGVEGDWVVVWEFFADEFDEDITAAGQRVVSISGLDVRSAPDDGIVYPRTVTSPHWEWGAPTLVENAGFENSAISGAAFQLSIDATAGTFTLTIGPATTGAINWNVEAPDLAIAIEALPNIVDVVISGDGTPNNPFIIEIMDPASIDIGTLSTNSGSLTGRATVQTLSVGGASLPDPWTRSFNPTNGLFHGTYNWFTISTEQSHTGTYSLKVDGDLGGWAGSFPGAQQIVSVGEGDNWAAVWVYPLFDARYRFGLRTVDETWITQVEADLTAGSWQELRIPTVNFPLYISQVIFRIACISNDHGVQVFYVDDAMLAPGFPATTWGDILGTLMDASFTRGTLDWLELGFNAAVDSDGAVWDTDDFHFQADALMKLGTHVIGDGEAAGYEHDIVPLDPPGVTTHQLLAYNPNGRGEEVVKHPALVLGSFNAARLGKRRVPYTHLLLEMNDGTHIEVTDPRVSDLPRRERGARVEQATDPLTAAKIGQAIFDKEIPNLLAVQVTLTGGTVVPYRDFDIGWIVPHTLGRRALKHERRIHVITSAYTENQWIYVVTS